MNCKYDLEYELSPDGVPVLLWRAGARLELHVSEGGRTVEGDEIARQVKIAGTREALRDLAALLVGLAESDVIGIHVHLDADARLRSPGDYALTLGRLEGQSRRGAGCAKGQFVPEGDDS